MGFLINRNVLSSSKFKSILKPLFCLVTARPGPTYAQQQTHAPTFAGDLKPNSKFMFMVENHYKETTNHSVISEKKLWKSEIPYRPFPERGYEIAGSCNGLYLVIDYDNGPGMSLWNPKINDFKTLPRSQVWCPRYSLDKSTELQFHYNDRYGFGFDSASNDYKAIRFLEYGYESASNDYKAIRLLEYGYSFYLVELYSLNSNSWKQITYPYPECHPADYCVHINGICYWITLGTPTNFILSFDFANEKFSSPPAHIPLPPEAEGIGDSYHKLVEFDGSLAVVVHGLRKRKGEPFSFMVWVWNGKSWSIVLPRITIDHVPVCAVVGLFQKHKLFLQGEGSELLLFDCEKRVLEILCTNHDDPSWFCVYPFVESYIPLSGK